MGSILAAMRANNPSRRTPLTPLPVPPGLLAPGVQPPSQTDCVGSGPWPVTYGFVGGFHLFQQDTGFSDSANDAALGWAALPEDQKEAYRARAEARRREAWASYERRLACKDAGLPAPPPPQPIRAPSASFLARVPGLVHPNPNPILPLSGFEGVS